MEGISPTLKHGTPTDDELEELGAVIEQKWRKLGRRLHVSDESLDEIDLKTRTELSEKGYHMLKLWKEREGSAATYEVLCHALKHNLVHHEGLAEKFCYINGPPTIQLYASPVQEERETGEVLCASAGTYVGGASGKDQDNSSGVRSGLKRKMLELNSELVKRGTPTDDELEGLGYKITRKWKKLGRRLHVSNSMLQEIDQAHAELSEKGYYMLMHWKETGSAATYKVLSDALKHEFVQRHDLARKYCYVNGYLPWKIDCASATSRISEEQDPEVKRKKVDRCMKQKVDETKEKFDLSSFAGLHDFYVHLVGELQLTNVNFYGSSITITVQCCTLEILERLWDYYCSGHLNEVAEKCLITEKVLEELGMQTIKLKTTILEEDYLACRLSLMQISRINIRERILQAFLIGFTVATFLLKTGHVLKAIEFWEECLIFLNDKALKLKENCFNFLHVGIYQAMFSSCCLIADYSNAIKHGRKLLNIFHEYGKTAEEENLTVILANMCEQQFEYLKAREFYEAAINIMKKTGDRKGEAYTYGKVGTMSYCLSDYNKAKEYLEKALAITIEVGDRRGEANSYGILGNVFLSLGEYGKANKYLEKALLIVIEIGDRAGEGTCYGNLGTVFKSLARYDKATAYLEKALEIKIQLGDRAGEASCYGNLGTVFQSLAEYKKAKEYLEKALAIRIQIGDRGGEAVEYGNLGTVFRSLGEYDMAKEYHEKALAIREQIGDKAGEAADHANLGTVFQSLGDYHKAKKYLEKALAIRIDIGDRKGEASCYANMGTVFQSLGQYDKAKEYLEKAFAIRIRIGDKAGEASCYENFGIVFQCLGEYFKAKEYLEKALAITILIGDRAGEASSYEKLGTVFQSLGQYDKAKEYLEKALTIAKQIGDRQAEASCFRKLGTVFQSLGVYYEANEFLEKALAITMQIGDKAGEASSYEKFGTVFQCLGEYDKAKEYLEKGLCIRIQIGDKQGEASSYGYLGTVFQSLGQYRKAKEYLLEALAIKIQIGDKEGEASSYGNLGTVFQSLGQYDRAREYLEKALFITKQICDKQGEASSYGNLGKVFKSLGQYDKAKEYLEKALATRIQIGDKAGEASCYVNLGIVFQSLSQYDKAKEYLEKALAIAIRIGDRAVEAICVENFGTVFQSLGQYDKAKEYLDRALAIAIQIGDRAVEAISLEKLGTVFQSLGEYSRAKEYLEKALAITSEIGDKAGEASSYEKFGTVFQSLGRYDNAKEYLKKALTITTGIGDRAGEASGYVKLGALFQSLGAFDKAGEYIKTALTITVEIGDRTVEASCYGNLAALYQAFGDYVMAEDYIEKALSIARDIGDLEKEFQFLCLLAKVKSEQGKNQEAFDCLFLSIRKSESLRSFLRDNDDFKVLSSDVRDFPYRSLSAFLCSSEDPNRALYVLELARARALADLMASQYSVETQISTDPQLWTGLENIMKKESKSCCLYTSYYGRDLFLWVLKTSGIIHFRRITLDEKVVGVSLVGKLDDYFAESFGSLGISGDQECEDRRLNDVESLSPLRVIEEDDEESENSKWNLSLYYRMLVSPVADLLDEPEIIVVPDRHLNQVPFQALTDERGRYLSETYRIRIVPSLTTLKLIQDSPGDYHSQTGALIVGDPDVGAAYYRGKVTSFSRLRCAENEAVMIGQLLDVQPLLGQQATKQVVLERLHSVSLIHFAAHGNAERGEIALAPVRPRNTIPEEEDYLLKMSDIAQVQLRAKLVVLSCCHSGCGQITAEGVIGIARAFLGSGARSVLVALWAIRDEVTEQLMCRFYEHLARGESASESLHQAMEWMRSNGFNMVRDWAPYMLIGDNVTFKFAK